MTMEVTIPGRIFSTPAAVTVLVGGTEKYSGQVGQGVTLDTETDLLTFEWDAADNDTVSVSIAVTSGVVTVGAALGQAQCDMRKNILINGQSPEEPSTSVDFVPAPDWAGWFFEVSAGETITFNMLNYPVGTII
jgi:hypothetical protein